MPFGARKADVARNSSTWGLLLQSAALGFRLRPLGRAVARKIEIADTQVLGKRGRAPETIKLVSADLRHHRPGSGHGRVGAVPGIGADDD